MDLRLCIPNKFVSHFIRIVNHVSHEYWAVSNVEHIHKFKSLFLFGTFSAHGTVYVIRTGIAVLVLCYSSLVFVCVSAFAYSCSHSFSLQSALWPIFKSVSSSNWLYPVGFSILVQRPSSFFHTNLKSSFDFLGFFILFFFWQSI